MIIKLPCEIGQEIEGYFGYQGYMKGYLAGVTVPMGNGYPSINVADFKNDSIIASFQLTDFDREDKAYRITQGENWCELKLPYEWHEMCSLEPFKIKGNGRLVGIHYYFSKAKYVCTFMKSDSMARRVEVESLPVIE